MILYDSSGRRTVVYTRDYVYEKNALTVARMSERQIGQLRSACEQVAQQTR